MSVHRPAQTHGPTSELLLSGSDFRVLVHANTPEGLDAIHHAAEHFKLTPTTSLAQEPSLTRSSKPDQTPSSAAGGLARGLLRLGLGGICAAPNGPGV